MSKYLSRKFILAVVGGLVVIVNAFLEANGMPAIDSEPIMAFVGLLASYILGEAFVDGRAAVQVQYYRSGLLDTPTEDKFEDGEQ